jgi:predicted amino acid-binding ACT domain protein
MSAQKIKYAILSIRTPDRPGIGATVSRFLFKHRANIVEEMGLVLNDDYGIQSFVFSADAERMAEIQRDCHIALKRFEPSLVPTRPPRDPNPGGEDGLPYVMDVVAQDAPGIGAQIEEKIAESQANISEVKGRRHLCKGGRKAFYTGSFKLRFPNAPALRQMRQTIAFLEHTHRWDIDLRPQNGFARDRTVVVVACPSKNKPKVNRSWEATSRFN